jgi:putative DNA modification/repair radical SAM protein
MGVAEKIAILADAAKYDASCASSGSARRNSPGGLGNGAVGGICHSWSSDGRCVALLKVLFTNVCLWDCAYCVNRRSNDIPRASFAPDELVRLIIDFYKRNYIEGAFLSSGVFSDPDTVMERLVGIARALRTRERFNGYLHLKAIPGASDAMIAESARWADRISVNVELPSASSLAAVAPEKTAASIFLPMRALSKASGFEPKRLIPPPPTDASRVRTLAQPANASVASPHATARAPTPCHTIEQRGTSRNRPRGIDVAPSFDAMLSEGRLCAAEPRPAYGSVMEERRHRARDPERAVLPAGQSTQLVVGASPESDATILTLAENLYLAYDVRRVYYSAYVPVGDASLAAPGTRVPLAREHRLYQADWLFRFYGFSASEIVSDSHPFLDESIDPKCAWALRNLHLFPIDLQKASYLELLRVPGIGPKSANRLLRARRQGRLSFDSLASLGLVMKRARFFICIEGKLPEPADGIGRVSLDSNPSTLKPLLRDGLQAAVRQLEFDWGPISLAASRAS